MVEIALYSADKEALKGLSREMSVPNLHFRAITLAVVDGWIGGYRSFDAEA